MDNNWKFSLEAFIDESSLSKAEKQLLKLLKRKINIPIGADSKTTQKLATDLQKITLVNTIKTWASNNTKALKQNEADIDSIISKLSSIDDLTRDDFNNLKQQFKEIQVHARETGNLGLTFWDKLNNAWSKFGGWTLSSSSLMFAASKTKEAVNELKEVDTLLTEISKANDNLSKSQLKEIGSSSFGVASKYGKKATNYLSGVQEASRAGYQNANEIAELSMAIQGAGDITDEIANKYVIATDKAYKLDGAIEDLTKVFDGSNYITNHNAVNMTDLAEGMTIVGSTSASLGVGVDETTAALGTMAATTQQSGSEVARAFRAILLNIRQISDEEEGIDAEGLTKYEKACNALNVELKETKNGVQSLRDPMIVLKELAEEYNKLDENDIRRTNLLNSVGGKLRATQLDALLRQWDTYETMLQQFEDGSGSMAQEAEKTANSWEGSINRLSNTWTSLVQNFVQSDTVTSGLQTLNTTINALGTVLSPVGNFLNIILTAFDGLIPKVTLLNVGMSQLPKLFNKAKDLKLVGRRQKIRLKVCPLRSTGNCERVKSEYGTLNKGLQRKQLKWCA